jgi:hypothetical protein
MDLDLLLDEYEAKLGLPAWSFAETEGEAKKILSLSPAELRAMSATQLGEAAFILQQFALHLQRAYNREQARVGWAEENIKRLTARTVGSVKGYSLEERRPLAVSQDELACKFDALRVKAGCRVGRLAYLSAKVEAMARSLMALQQSKRGKHD